MNLVRLLRFSRHQRLSRCTPTYCRFTRAVPPRALTPEHHLWRIDLGINEGTLGNWIARDRQARVSGDGALSEDERAELVRRARRPRAPATAPAPSQLLGARYDGAVRLVKSFQRVQRLGILTIGRPTIGAQGQASQPSRRVTPTGRECA